MYGVYHGDPVNVEIISTGALKPPDPGIFHKDVNARSFLFRGS